MTSSRVSGVRMDSVAWATYLTSFAILHFYLARATPKHPLLAEDDQTLMTSGLFVLSMFAERGPVAKKFFAVDQRPLRVLHPDFRPLADVLSALHSYFLAMPWREMYTNPDFPHHLHPHPARAAVVMRRILLTALTDPTLQSTLDIELNTDAPRHIVVAGEDYSQQFSEADPHLKAVRPTTPSSTASSGLKRKRSNSMSEEPGNDPPSPPKRSRQGGEDSIEPSDTMSPAVSAQALGRMIRKDHLWYTTSPCRQQIR